ncbi:ABC transporter permease [Tenacibaculum sp. UWU-22]|uniref:ABC transporter permease n=1 Tax=Tenacibaculum sp. UWU-22 TaxID=3234187 RepID=UPI0034DB441F
MKIIFHIIKKEFKQIFRNKGMLPIIFILPVIQLLILSNAATYEIKNITFGYVDADNSVISRGLIDKFKASTYFNVSRRFSSEKEASKAMLEGKIKAYINIPTHLEQALQKNKTKDIGVFIDAIDGSAAGVINVYITQIIQNYNKHIATQFIPLSNTFKRPISIDSIPLFWYNKTLNYKTFMVPGILVLFVTMITLFLSGMNIVREKEIGTLEQINVTPIKKQQFIIGKLFPFWVIGLGLLTIGLFLAKVIFNVPILGSLSLLYGYTSIYILVVLGIGLFISNFTDTQQQAMFISWFFMVIFILMSGLFTPIESMPKWAQLLTDFNPIKYFVQIIRMVMLKGAGFVDILPLTIKTAVYAFIMNSLAVLSYKKTN